MSHVTHNTRTLIHMVRAKLDTRVDMWVFGCVSVWQRTVTSRWERMERDWRWRHFSGVSRVWLSHVTYTWDWWNIRNIHTNTNTHTQVHKHTQKHEHTQTHTHTNTHRHTHTHKHTHTQTHKQKHTHTHTLPHARAHTHTHTPTQNHLQN